MFMLKFKKSYVMFSMQKRSILSQLLTQKNPKHKIGLYTFKFYQFSIFKETNIPNKNASSYQFRKKARVS